MTTVHDVCETLKTIAPLNLAEGWDNVGLLLGDESANVSGVLTCLTLTSDVAAEAVAAGVGLIVTHHPILFKAIQRITADTAEGRLLLTLARHAIAVYSPHTAWDNCATGINQQLAEGLQLQQIQPLRKSLLAEQSKIVTFVPREQLEAVREALWQAGAGTIGNYDRCSFMVQGTGTFYGSEATNPAIGQAGRLEMVDEIRLEVICRKKDLERAVIALRNAHPYEEPAIDVLAVQAPAQNPGAGRFGELAVPATVASLAQQVATQLRQPSVQFTGESDAPITRVGVACGAAAEFLKDAHRCGCQVLVTGEARFHACLEAREIGINLILPGHYATERFAMETLAERLSRLHPDVTIRASEAERDPLQTC